MTVTKLHVTKIPTNMNMIAAYVKQYSIALACYESVQ